MSEAADIQHKATFKSESGFGFENGERVPIVVPADDVDHSAESRAGLTAERLLDLLLIGNKDLRTIGERAVLVSYRARACIYGPKNLRELGTRLGCSHVAARAKLNKLLRELRRDFENLEGSP